MSFFAAGSAGLSSVVDNSTASATWPARYWWTFLLTGADEIDEIDGNGGFL